MAGKFNSIGNFARLALCGDFYILIFINLLIGDDCWSAIFKHQQKTSFLRYRTSISISLFVQRHHINHINDMRRIPKFKDRHHYLLKLNSCQIIDINTNK